jgi:hypothetical protein
MTGDSHARGYVAEISSGLGKDFEVTGTVCLELDWRISQIWQIKK